MGSAKHKKKTARILALIGLCLAMLMAGTAVADLIIAGQVHYRPDYEMEDIRSGIQEMREDLNGEYRLTEEDYKELFYQTGLGKPAVNDLIARYGGSEELLTTVLAQYQANFFGSIDYSRNKFGIITYEELLVNEKGETKAGFDLAPLKNGDIFMSPSTMSLGWRHGHNAIVVDAAGRRTLEAVLIGYDSMFQKADKWRKYPAFMILRLRSDAPGAGTIPDMAAEFAEKRLEGMPYGLLTGMIDKNPDPDKISHTQCAHIVWYPYMQLGFDLDSDGGWLVTPHDIAESSELEVVQIYGMDPHQFWP